MDERLNNQARAWDEVIKETDLQNPTTPLAQNAKGFSDQVNSLDSALSSVEKAYAGEGDDQNRDRDDRQNDPNSLDEKLKSLTSASDELGKNLDELSSQHSELSEALKNAFKDSADETSKNINNLISQEIRQVSAQGSAGADSIQNSFTSSIYGLAEASNVIVRDAGNSLEAQRRDIAGKVENLKASLDGSPRAPWNSWMRAPETPAATWRVHPCFLPTTSTRLSLTWAIAESMVRVCWAR